MKIQKEIQHKMRIAHIINGDTWAGAEVVTYELLRSLVNDRNIDITVIMLNKGIVYEKIADLGIKTYFCSDDLPFYTLVKKIATILKNEEIDILHVHKRPEDTMALFVKMYCKDIILIRTIHGMTEKRGGLRAVKDFISRLVDKLILKLVFTRIVAVSHDIKKNYGKKFIRHKTIVIHNAVDSKRIQYQKNRHEMKHMLFGDKDIFLIGSVGRLFPVKGHDIFLKMAKIVSDQIEKCRFVLVGEGSQRKDLEILALKLGIDRKVIFTGFQDNVYDYINSFNVFVLSSLSEGIPAVILESAILNVPIISTDVGGISEILDDGESAKLVQASDPDALANACIKAYNSYPKAIKQSEVAYNHIIKNFSINSARDKIKQLYKRVI